MNENPGGDTPKPVEENPASAAEPVIAPAAPTVATTPKKKKTGLIIGIIAAVLVLGGGVAAYFLFFSSNPTKILNSALEKIADGKRPQYVHEEGTFTLSQGDMNLSGKVTSENDLKALSSSDEISISLDGGQGMAINTNAHLFLDNGEDLYAKIDGSDLLDEIAQEYLGISTDLFTDKWIHLEASSLNNLGFSSQASLYNTFDDDASCDITNIDDIKDLLKILEDIYKGNAFLKAEVAKSDKYQQKNSPLYKVTIDTDKAVDFVYAFMNSDKLPPCLKSQTEINKEDIKSSLDFSSLPNIYVEINSSLDFTRLIIDGDSEETSFSIDVSMSYPTGVSIEKPDEYYEVEDIIGGLYGYDYDFGGEGEEDLITICEAYAEIESAYDLYLENDESVTGLSDDDLYDLYDELKDNFEERFGNSYINYSYDCE